MAEITRDAVESIFAEWHRRYTEEPERFNEEWRSMEATSYGRSAAEYFKKLYDELF